MFKSISVVATIGLAFALAGCNTTTITAAQIQAATLQACNFEPTAVEIAGLIPNVNSNILTDANSVATAICAAVKNASTTKAAAKRNANAPVVTNVVLPNGQIVKVTGVFVK
jgi:hypothetical protein